MTTGYIEAQVTVPSGTTLSATTPDGGPTAVTITAGTYLMTDLITHVQAALNAQRSVGSGGVWEVETSQADGFIVTITTDNASTFSITWTTSALGTLLGHTTITSQTSVAGSTACHGFFIPDRPLNLDDDPRAAPMLTDLRETDSPTGHGLAVVSNAKYVHSNLRWALVSRERYLDTDSGVTPSWERFVKNTQLGQGHSWFMPRSKVRIMDQTGAYVGSTGGVTKWWMRGVRSVTAEKQNEAWTGAWMIRIPGLVSDGT